MICKARPIDHSPLRTPERSIAPPVANVPVPKSQFDTAAAVLAELAVAAAPVIKRRLSRHRQGAPFEVAPQGGEEALLEVAHKRVAQQVDTREATQHGARGGGRVPAEGAVAGWKEGTLLLLRIRRHGGVGRWWRPCGAGQVAQRHAPPAGQRRHEGGSGGAKAFRAGRRGVRGVVQAPRAGGDVDVLPVPAWQGYQWGWGLLKS